MGDDLLQDFAFAEQLPLAGDHGFRRQADVNSRAGEFEAQYAAPAFERLFGAAVGATKARHRRPHHRIGVDDAAMPPHAHDGRCGHGKLVPAGQAGANLPGEATRLRSSRAAGMANTPLLKRASRVPPACFNTRSSAIWMLPVSVQIELHRVQAFLFQAFNSGGTGAGKTCQSRLCSMWPPCSQSRWNSR